jgi:hypothetical protein
MDSTLCFYCAVGKANAANLTPDTRVDINTVPIAALPQFIENRHKHEQKIDKGGQP